MEGEDKRAVGYAMKILLQQDRTEKQLRERLERSGFSEAAIQCAVNYVAGFGYIDDLRYAVNYLSYRKDRHSRKELRYKLQNKGVPPEILQEAMETYPAEEELEPAAYLLQKRLGGRSLSQMEYGDRNKVASYLARKGFSMSVIRRVMCERK